MVMRVLNEGHKNLKQSTITDMARRYLWFISKGVKHPTLNDPKVIFMEASPDHVDKLIQEGMERWPGGISMLDNPLLKRDSLKQPATATTDDDDTGPELIA